MIDPRQFRLEVIRPTLKHLMLWNPAAERLLLGTAITESGLVWLRQHGSGPALGVYQIEPATHDDIWENFLKYREALRFRVENLRTPWTPGEPLIWNLAYATAMARLVYYRRPAGLPAATDIDGLAGYWKRYYNTRLGAGRPEDFVRKAGSYVRQAIEEDNR